MHKYWLISIHHRDMDRIQRSSILKRSFLSFVSGKLASSAYALAHWALSPTLDDGVAVALFSKSMSHKSSVIKEPGTQGSREWRLNKDPVLPVGGFRWHHDTGYCFSKGLWELHWASNAMSWGPCSLCSVSKPPDFSTPITTTTILEVSTIETTKAPFMCSPF